MPNVAATFSFDKSTITELPTGAAVLTLGGTAGAWTLTNESAQLLGATAVKKLAWGKGATTWSISIADGNATIQNGTSSYGRFLYNVNSPRFTTYTSNTSASMLLPQLYRLETTGEEGGGEEIPTVPGEPVLPEEQTFRGSMLVEITGIAADATVYYTTDESDPATSNTRIEYTAPFEITATTTVKAVAVNEVGASETVTKTYTLFVVEETEGYYIKVVSEPTDWSGKYLVVYEDGADAYVFNGEDEVNGYVSATTDGNIIKATSEVDAVAVTIATMEGGYSIMTAGGYISGTANANKLNFSTTEQLNTIAYVVGEGVEIVSNTSVLRFNSASNNMRFRYYKSETYASQQPVQLYKYVEALPSYTLTVTDAGYATLYLGFPAEIPAEVKAYTVTEANEGYVILTQVTGVLPANTGVIVEATKGNYDFVASTGETANVAGNLLEGTVDAANITEEAYVLGVVNKTVGLYKADMASGVWLNNANKAYLPASAVPNKSVAFYGFDWDGTTGVENVVVENEVKTIFDLTGRRVEAITAPGIYIVNGKKVLVK
ncbi:MAG: chitobiase/beta-hexosaminidase C-terminal domain-containing protein [Bacteroidaceae bacterium]|nr:chitobiase/beta-hexosaminidase C-terminal domain-containing protein [Bacteroidaceae bacterium]